MEATKKMVARPWFKEIFVKLLKLYRHQQSRRKWVKLMDFDRIWMELGSGPKKGTKGWTTVDINGADINYDLRKGIPLPDESVDRIYTSHMLEHLPYKELLDFINECYRVLRVGGELSVCVPNASLYIRAYI